MLAAIPATLGYIYTNTGSTEDTTTPSDNITTTTTTPVPACGDGWEESLEYCYKAFSVSMTFTEAEGACTSEPDANLASITTTEENEFVLSLLENVDGWLGGKFVSPDWTWVDTKPWDDDIASSFWDTDAAEPVDGNDYIKMKGDTGKWITAQDDDASKAEKYICKKLKPSTTTTTTTSTGTTTTTTTTT